MGQSFLTASISLTWLAAILYLLSNKPYNSYIHMFHVLLYIHVIFHRKKVIKKKKQIHLGYCVGRQVCKQEAQLSTKDMMEAWTGAEK